MDEVLAGGVARDALEVARVDQRIAMDAHEAGTELLFQDLERIVDQVFTTLMSHGGVFLVGDETSNLFHRDELESIAPAHADVSAARAFARRARDLLQLW